MLQLVLNSANKGEESAELFIDYQSGSVGFAVCTKTGLQFDFSCESEEWNQIKTFIEQAKSQESKTKR